MKNRTITTIAIMALVLICGYFASACSISKETPSVPTTEPAEETTAIIDDMTEESFSGIYPEVIPESSHETVILSDIEEAVYHVWLPGDKPQTRWRRSKEVSNTFMLTEDTAIVEYNGILSSGMPDETGTVYVLANLASVSAIREVCWAAELKGACRVVVCDISTYDEWFDKFVERRAKNNET